MLSINRSKSFPRQLLTNSHDAARPTLGLQSFRPMQAAWISNSSAKKAEPVMQKPGLVSTGANSAFPAKMRQEVPLPSQEGKKGVVQYALYVNNEML